MPFRLSRGIRRDAGGTYPSCGLERYVVGHGTGGSTFLRKSTEVYWSKNTESTRAESEAANYFTGEINVLERPPSSGRLEILKQC